MEQRFRKRERLQRRVDFERVFAVRCSRGDAVLTVYAAANDLDWSRLGIITSKKVGPAVKRNYARRRIREAFRRMKAELPVGVDFICIAKPATAVRATDVAGSLRTLAEKAASRCRKVDF